MGSSKTDNVARKRMRERFRSWGMDEKEIEACIAQIKERQLARRRGLLPDGVPLCTRAEYLRLLRKNKPANDNSAAVLKLGENYKTSDDKGYKPAYIDPVLRGVGRATGATAKAVKRGTSDVKFHYDEEE